MSLKNLASVNRSQETLNGYKEGKEIALEAIFINPGSEYNPDDIITTTEIKRNRPPATSIIRISIRRRRTPRLQSSIDIICGVTCAFGTRFRSGFVGRIFGVPGILMEKNFSQFQVC